MLIQTSNIDVNKEDTMAENIDQYLSVKEAAELMGVTRQSIYDWMKSGMKFIQKGNARLIHKSDLIDMSIEKDSRRRGGEPRKGEQK